MIANEMNRGQKMLKMIHIDEVKLSIERTLNLLDLTVSANTFHGLRKELLRLRELVANMYRLTDIELKEYNNIFKALLLLNTESAKQIPFVHL